MSMPDGKRSGRTGRNQVGEPLVNFECQWGAGREGLEPGHMTRWLDSAFMCYGGLHIYLHNSCVATMKYSPMRNGLVVES